MGSTIKSDAYWQSNLSSPSPLPFLLWLFFLRFVCVSRYLDKLPPRWSAGVLLFIQVKANHPGTNRHNARTNQKRRWKIMMATTLPADFLITHNARWSELLVCVLLRSDTCISLRLWIVWQAWIWWYIDCLGNSSIHDPLQHITRIPPRCQVTTKSQIPFAPPRYV